MIGKIAVRVTADWPNLSLGPLFVRRGSAANVALLGVPVRAGVDVRAVAVRVENVDGATADYSARAFGGVWVVDLPASHFATIGSVSGGVSVWATGIGADGETARTWCLGVGDLEVLPADADAPAPTPGQVFWPLRMFDAAPATPQKYNAYIDGNALKIWNGTAWVEISGESITLDDAVTRASANGVKSSGIWNAIWGALAALPTGFSSLYDWCVSQLAGKFDKSGGEVTGDIVLKYQYETYRIFGIEWPDPGVLSSKLRIYGGWDSPDTGMSLFLQGGTDNNAYAAIVPRTQGGNLAFAASNPTAGNLAALDASGNPTDSGVKASDKLDSTSAAPAWVSGTSYDADTLVSYNGVVYKNTSGDTLSEDVTPDTSGSGWTAKKVSELFLPLTGGKFGSILISFSDDEGIYIFDPSTGEGSLFSNTHHFLVRRAGDGNRYIYTVPDKSGTLALTSDIPILPFSTTTSYAVGNLCYYDSSIYRCKTAHEGAWDSTKFELVLGLKNGIPTVPTATSGTNTTQIATTAFVQDAMSGITPGPDNTKLDSTSAAPAFDSTVGSTATYAVGEHVTYNGKLYVCTTATTGGNWDASKWTADTMTDPDAVLDITAQNQLRVVAKDGTLLWAQGYDLASTSSATLACDAVNNFTFADGATTQAFALPTAPTGKAGDFGLDIDNSANTGAATLTLTGLDTTFSVVIPEGESLTDMLAIAAGELARFYVTLTTFSVNSLPTWHIVKQVVENGGATA